MSGVIQPRSGMDAVSFLLDAAELEGPPYAAGTEPARAFAGFWTSVFMPATGWRRGWSTGSAFIRRHLYPGRITRTGEAALVLVEDHRAARADAMRSWGVLVATNTSPFISTKAEQAAEHLIAFVEFWAERDEEGNDAG